MSLVPEDLSYTESHEWVRREADGSVSVGITDHAQQALGDLVYLELPKVGRQVKAREELGVVESVKAASDIYSPLTGEVTAVNEALGDAPELVNRDPYGEGWILRLRPAAEAEMAALLSPATYAELAAAAS
jgi:glycine cleavage system H protein